MSGPYAGCKEFSLAERERRPSSGRLSVARYGQVTRGFQGSNDPLGFGFQIHEWSA